jgi:hypothetical protein
MSIATGISLNEPWARAAIADAAAVTLLNPGSQLTQVGLFMAVDVDRVLP